MQLTPNDLKKGVTFAWQGDIYEVLEYRQKVLARQAATVTVRARNLLNQKMLTHTFQGAEVIEGVELFKISVQFLYADGRKAYFLDPLDGTQYDLEEQLLEAQRDYLAPEQKVVLYLRGNQPLGLELPKNVDLKVVVAPAVVKGDTSGDLSKEVEVETGLKVKTPAFIKEGDLISVDTSTGAYRGRQK